MCRRMLFDYHAIQKRLSAQLTRSRSVARFNRVQAGRMNRLRRFARTFGVGRSICILLLFALIGLRFWDPPPLQELRLRTFDTYQKLAPRQDMPNSPAIILDIDEQSLTAFGQWPWPRTL